VKLCAGPNAENRCLQGHHVLRRLAHHFSVAGPFEADNVFGLVEAEEVIYKGLAFFGIACQGLGIGFQARQPLFFIRAQGHHRHEWLGCNVSDVRWQQARRNYYDLGGAQTD
jgi:hypothetical protein